jgi:RHS repeat-associated protein
MPGRLYQDGTGYRYGYQGQETDAETGWSAFQLRMYDGRLGRWMTTDPKSQYFSPYLAMGNTPMRSIDPSGGWSWSSLTAPLTDFFNLNGDHVRHVEDGKNDRVLVLTTSRREKEVSAAIAQGFVLNRMSMMEADLYSNLFSRTEQTGNEHFMAIGKMGTLGAIVVGGPISVTPGSEAYQPLVAAGDVVERDIHTHPNLAASGGLMGVASPSGGDLAVIGALGDPSRINGILGYDARESRNPNVIGGGSVSVEYVRQVGFHNSNGIIGRPMTLPDFQRAVRRMTNWVPR